MKKLFSLIIVLVMLVCVCGCTSDGGDKTTSEDVEYDIVYEQEEHKQEPEEQESEQQQSVEQESQEQQSQVQQSEEQESEEQEQHNETSSENITSSEESSSSDTSTESIDSSVVSSGSKKEIDYNTITEVDICTDAVRGYLSATDEKNQYFWLSTYQGMQLDYQSVTLNWYRDGSSIYTVYFSENADFSDPIIIESVHSTLESTNFIPGKTYYWKVTGTITSDVLDGGRIKIVDAPVRWINVDGVGNVRDMGGWKAEGGKTVKYGMLYRGKALGSLENNAPKIYVTDDGLKTIKELGWKTELDIRYANQKFQTPGTGMNYEFIESPGQYDNVLTSEPEVFKASYKRVFELLSDESNYPFYAHCNAGADRTGTFAFIVNGVLGVSYEDLTRDFELTSFSSSGKRWREDGSETMGNFVGNDGIMETTGNYVAWGVLYDKMMEYGSQNGCTTLQDSIEHWLLNYVGVQQSQIDSFKNIMLG